LSTTTQNQNIVITRGNENDLKRIFPQFELDFPPSERKSFEHLSMLLRTGNYKLILMKHIDSNEILGYAMIYSVEESNTLWLDYIAINSNHQSSGYGSLLFNRLIELEGSGCLGIFIEIEIPEENDIDQVRRIKFYERLNSRKLNIEYKIPDENDGFRIDLYFKSFTNDNTLPSIAIQQTIQTIYDNIHSDVENRHLILDSIINTIKDTYIGPI